MVTTNGTLAVLLMTVWYLLPAQGETLCPRPAAAALSRVRLDPATVPGVRADRYWPGTRAVYSCDPGYLLVGEAVRTCGSGGAWTSRLPACHLNVAEQSNLTALHPTAVDGDYDTGTTLQNVFRQGTDIVIDLFFTYQLLDVRLITGQLSPGFSIDLGDKDGIWGRTEYKNKPGHGRRVDYSLGLFEQLVTLSGATDARYLRLSVNDHEYRQLAHHPASIYLYELQITAKTDEVSWRHCLEVENASNQVYSSWSAGGQCFHLVRPATTQANAEQECQRLTGGTLLRLISTELLHRVANVLTSKSNNENFSQQRVWTSGQRNPFGQWTWGINGPNVVASWTPAGSSLRCLALRRSGHHWQIARTRCRSVHWFICQREATLCGSPPREEGLVYDLPGPRRHAGTIAVTCPDRLSGNIVCRNGHWFPGEPSRVLCPNATTAATTPDESAPDAAENGATDYDQAVGDTAIRRSDDTRIHFAAEDGSDQRGTGYTTVDRNDADQLPEAENKYLGALVGGIIGGAVVLSAVISIIVCNWRRRRPGDAGKTINEPYNFMEFAKLNHNPIYQSDGDENVYSEISEEAIYEDPGQLGLTVVPPPPPSTQPPSPSAPAADPGPQYEPLSSPDQLNPLYSPAAAWPPSDAADRSSVSQYSQPLVDGQRTPRATVPNSSLTELPKDGSHAPGKNQTASDGGEGRDTCDTVYALPYDAMKDDQYDTVKEGRRDATKDTWCNVGTDPSDNGEMKGRVTLAGERRSIPDVALPSINIQCQP